MTLKKHPKVRNIIDSDYTPSNLIDTSNPYSLINMLPSSNLKKFLVQAEESLSTKTFNEVEEDMLAMTKPTNVSLIKHLRLAFWHEYEIAQGSRRELSPARVFEGSCGSTRFRYIMAKPEQAAYIFSRPIEHEIKLKMVLNNGHERLMEVLEMDLLDHKGNANVALIKEIREIYKMADLRLNGGIIQKLHQTSLNVNATPGQIDQALTPAEIDEKLLLLQKEMNPNSLVINVDTDETRPIEATAVKVTRE